MKVALFLILIQAILWFGLKLMVGWPEIFIWVTSTTFAVTSVMLVIAKIKEEVDD